MQRGVIETLDTLRLDVGVAELVPVSVEYPSHQSACRILSGEWAQARLAA